MGEGDLRPLAGQPWLVRDDTRRVLDALERDGAPARFVGGCVRDGLLGIAGSEPDIDIATAEPPERVTRLLEAAGIRAIPTGIAHGTITALVGSRPFEVTTLRRDVRTDGRHAEVAFTDSFQEDAARRDFTINAMSAGRDGRVHDYFGGLADLAAGRIRFVGDPATRIREDFLRVLRFFRFMARHGRGAPDEPAVAACAAATRDLGRLSGERVQVEMLKLLDAADPLPSLALMERTGVAAEVFPGSVGWERLRNLLRLRPDAPALLRLAALLRPPPAPEQAAERVAERWRLSSADRDRLLDATGGVLPDLAAGPEAWRRAIYRAGATRFPDLASLAAAERGDAAREDLARALAEADRFRPPPLPVGGADVLALGVAPGPAVGEILRRIEADWLMSDFALDRSACLERLRRHAADVLTPGPDGPGGRG